MSDLLARQNYWDSSLGYWPTHTVSELKIIQKKIIILIFQMLFFPSRSIQYQHFGKASDPSRTTLPYKLGLLWWIMLPSQEPGDHI